VAQKHQSHREDNASKAMSADEVLQVSTKGKKKCKAGGSAKKLKMHEACALIPDLYRAKLLQNAEDDEEGTLSQPLADFVINELVRHVTFLKLFFEPLSPLFNSLPGNLAFARLLWKISEAFRN
jgi:hypothetical protein